MIAEEKSTLKLVPDAAAIEISASDEKGASGVILVPEYNVENPTNYYFNALVAGNKVTLKAQSGTSIKSATTTNKSTDMEVASDGSSATFTPAPIKIDVNGQISDEEITVEMADGQTYAIHTVSENLPTFYMTGNGVSADDAGVYTFAINSELIRVNSDREVVYYRDISCFNEQAAPNFQVEQVGDDYYFAFPVTLNTTMGTFGMTNGAFNVMDSNYVDQELVTLAANTDKNHTHGEGYLDTHEFRILGPHHYLVVSYTPLEITNLPSGIEGVNGTSHAYVDAGIVQEIKDGKVVAEINTTDYPDFYTNAVEGRGYAASTGQNDRQPTSWCDYVHINSLDYILNDDGSVDKLLVSMRMQSAVVQFDMETGYVEWILGGKASTLSGYEDYTTTRQDTEGNSFEALTFGQHYARYSAVNSDGTMKVSVFDNATGTQPYMYENGTGLGTHTRVMELTINPSEKTAVVDNCVQGRTIDLITGKDHVGDHCGSVEYYSPTSTTIGWGLHIPVDAGLPIAAQYGWEPGDHPVFTDWNDETQTVSLELCVKNSKFTEKQQAQGITGENMTGAYRTYKTAK